MLHSRLSRPLRRCRYAVAWIVGAAALPCVLTAQENPRINGRVVDADTGGPVSLATITLRHIEIPDSVLHTLVTDDRGLFQVMRTRSGEYDVTVEHIAYGTFTDRVTLSRGQDLALRVDLSPTAIELRPVVVEGVREEIRTARARGTSRRVVTWEELQPVAETGAYLGVAMSQLLPGVRLNSQRSTPGERICLEFRNPATLQGGVCSPPLVFVDGVRQANPTITINTMPITDIRRLEILPPGEAGVQYGTDSQSGVVLIETFTGGSFLRGGPLGSRSSGAYDWALESDPYPWARSLALAAGANAVGLLAGYALAQSCLPFDDLTAHFYEGECGFLGNTAARTALYLGPQVAVGYLVQRLGGTNLSRGSMWKSAIASMIMTTPGIVLSVANEEDGFTGSRGLGVFMIGVGAPVAAVAADRLFRHLIP